MAEQTTVNRDAVIKQQLLASEGLLEQFNLPPKVIAFIHRHQRTIWTVIVTAVVVFVAVSGYTTYRELRETRGASALDAALIAQQDRKPLLEKVTQDYGGTAADRWAKIELATLYAQEGQRGKAIETLEVLQSELRPDMSLKPLVLSRLAGLCEMEGQVDKAVQLYTQLSGNEWFAAEAYRALGRLYEQTDKKEEAVAMYGKYLELSEFQAGQGKVDPIREMVQSRLGQLQK
ncbi:tetratricopeptide repeat protein [Desulfobulbus oligotrophicus]|uniref:Ancillary SecYEG translocon subunit n=1 Tax=Desulfobulbus oligotrophicus TaxID=1909699 RepID=A0A7T5VF97_9BACT|nr:tetratricopeptide repeat protein [Desulfobulbus oligotrophicus]MDY0389927.1 tetratricopeptide repeat protein [Desulfobulbus oligotrophicus]QQG66814.1 tetratricopeptide repeat protein [Desulfobulbus oligotrophicus]